MSKFTPAQTELMDRAAEEFLTHIAKRFSEDYTHVPPEGALCAMAKMMAMYLASWGATTSDQKGHGGFGVAVHVAEAEEIFQAQLEAMLPQFAAMMMANFMEAQG